MRAKRISGKCCGWLVHNWLVVTVICGFVATLEVQGAEDWKFLTLGYFPGSSGTSSSAYDVSEDGSVVVGSSEGRAFRWTAVTGLEDLGDLPGGQEGAQATAVSGNGLVIGGWSYSDNGQEAFRWTRSAGMVGLGDLPGGSFRSEVSRISSNGSVIVGYSSSEWDGVARNEAFRWSGSMAGLGFLVPEGSVSNLWSKAYAVSGNGSVIVGESKSSNGSQAFRRVGGGLESLGAGPNSVAYGVSENGGWIVGFYVPGYYGYPFIWNAQSSPQLTQINFRSGRAVDVSADGSVVLLMSGSGEGPHVWDGTNEVRSLYSIISGSGNGVDLTNWQLIDGNAISADGSTIVGRVQRQGSTTSRGFIVTRNALPTPRPSPNGGSPNVLTRGQQNVSFLVRGEGFYSWANDGYKVSLGPGISVGDARVVDSDTLEVTIRSVSTSTALGGRKIEVWYGPGTDQVVSSASSVMVTDNATPLREFGGFVGLGGDALEGVTVRLSKTDGTPETVAETVTGADGRYLIQQPAPMPEGDYEVAPVSLDGSLTFAPAFLSVNVAGSNYALNFEALRADPGSSYVPKPPILVSPANGSREVSLIDVGFSWAFQNDPSDIADVEISIWEMASTGWWTQKTVSEASLGVATSYSLNLLESEKLYKWQVEMEFVNGERTKAKGQFRTGPNQSVAPAFRFAESSVSVREPEGTELMLIEVQRIGDVNSPAEADFVISPVGSSDLPVLNEDFTVLKRNGASLSGSLLFEPGERRHFVALDILGDDVVENDEHLEIALLESSSLPIESPGVTTVTILDSSTGPRQISGRILNKFGFPQNGVSVDLKCRDGSVVTTLTATDGTYSLSGARPGDVVEPQLAEHLRAVPPTHTVSTERVEGYNFGVWEPVGSVPNVSNRDRNNKGKSTVSDPIDTVTGAQVLTETLFSLNGSRPLSFTVRYNSLQKDQPGTLGHGWTHNFEVGLSFPSVDEVTVHWSPNQSYSFERSMVGSNVFGSRDSDAYYWVLEKRECGEWMLTLPNQEQFVFDADGELAGHLNEAGQILFVTQNAGRVTQVTEPLTGETLTFAYNGNLLESVTDRNNRGVTLTHSGNLLTGITNPRGQARTYTYNADNQLESGVDHEGRLLFLNTHDAEGRVVQQDDGRTGNLQGTFVYAVQPDSTLTTVYTNRMGVGQTFTHDAQWNLTHHQLPEIGTIQQSFDVAGNLTGVFRPSGRNVTIDYSSAGNPTRLIDPAGNESTFSYDGRNNPTEIVNALGAKTEFEFNSSNAPASVTDALGNSQAVGTDPFGNPLAVQSAEGRTVEVRYVDGRPAAYIDPEGNTSTVEYDGYGRPFRWTDAKGATREVEYDLSDNVTLSWDAEGREWRLTYDSHGNPLTITDPLNAVWQYEYDGNRNLFRITNPLGKTVSRAFDGEDRLIAETDENGHTTEFERDSLGRIVAVKDALGHRVQLTLDLDGNVTAVTDREGIVAQETTYNQMQLPAEVKDALERVTTFSYNQHIQLAGIEAPDGTVTKTLTFDPAGQLTTVAEPLGLTSRQSFDKDGLLRSFTNPRNAETVLGHDASGQVASVTTPEGRATTYTRDANGWVSQVQKPDGSIVSFTRDRTGLVTAIDYGDEMVGMAYDGKGRPTVTSSGAFTVSRVFDPLDRITRYVGHYGEQVDYQYDDAGNRTRITYPDGKFVDYAYNARNELVRTTDWQGRVVEYGYDKNGRHILTTYPNGVTESRVYDVAGQLSEIHVQKGAVTLLRQQFAYNARGTVRTETFTPERSFVAGFPFVASYSADNRLSEVNGSSPAIDPNGNLLNFTFQGRSHALTYTKRGKLDSADGYRYTYSAEGDRVAITDQSGTVTSFVLDGASAFKNVLLRSPSGGSPTYYVYGLGLSYEVTDGVARFYHFDRRGSTVLMVSEAGQAVCEVHYTPFGQISYRSTGPGTPFLFNGQFGVQTDPNGLYFMRARYYSPELRRFLSQDEVLGSVADSASLNRFAYANGNPVSLVDPFGLAASTGEVELKKVGFGDHIRDFGSAFGDALYDSFVDSHVRLYRFTKRQSYDEGFVHGLSAGVGMGFGTVGFAEAVSGEDIDINSDGSYSVKNAGGLIGRAGNLLEFGLGAAPIAGGAVGAHRGLAGLARTRRVSAEIHKMAVANIKAGGKTVLGHYPGYIEKAKKTGGSYFDVGDAWNTLTDAQRTAADRHFLDAVAASGDQIYLSVPKQSIRRGSTLADEVMYLVNEKGYKWINQWSLRP